MADSTSWEKDLKNGFIQVSLDRDEREDAAIVVYLGDQVGAVTLTLSAGEAQRIAQELQAFAFDLLEVQAELEEEGIL